MLTSFITNDNFRALSASYLYDNQIDFLNNRIGIDGNLTTFFSPILKETLDYQNNNYSYLHLTKPLKLSEITDFTKPINTEKTLFCAIKNNEGKFLKAVIDPSIPDTTIPIQLTQGFFEQDITRLDNECFFEINLSNPYKTTVGHLYKNKFYYLCYNPFNYSLRFLNEDNFSGGLENTKFFFYSYDDKTNLLTLQTRINNLPYYTLYDPSSLLLIVSGATEMGFNNERRFFSVKSVELPLPVEITNDWGSYEQSFNQNNLKLNEQKSYFNVENNFLVHSEYDNLVGTALKTNVLTLKNQLNVKHAQGRGNVFLDENDTFYRNYNAIFSGRRQEEGYQKLHLQYDSYSTPIEFRAGKTTWFHTPQNMYPYKRLNLKSSKLIYAGAIAGDHPLRSDKVFKKLANYKSSFNLGDSSGEQTGQWLCSWLSGGENISIKPVWVDRFYNPKLVTPFQALSATDGNVTYIPTFDCLNLPYEIVDVPTSLTFEPGCLYAYSRIGKVDVDHNISSLNKFLQINDFDSYTTWNGAKLDPEKDLDGKNIYSFNGENVASFNVKNINFGGNKFTLSFWGYSEDWTSPKGYQLLGNYNDYGFGFFNYNTVTPFIFINNRGVLSVYNTNSQLVDIFDASQRAFGNIQYVLRRDPLNSFHVITDSEWVVEFDLRETIIDATSALFSPVNTIIHASNDEARGYILYSNRSLSAIDLTSNLLFPVSAEVIIGNSNAAREVHRLNDGRIALVDGTRGIVRSDKLYFLSSGAVMTYNTTTNRLSTVIGPRGAFSYFNIDGDNYLWAGDANFIAKFAPSQEALFTVSLTADRQFSTSRLAIQDVSFIETFENGTLLKSVLITASGSDTTNALLMTLTPEGVLENTTKVNIQGNYQYVDATNHRFNYNYLVNRYGNGNYTFKTRLYNPFNNEDIVIPSTTVNSADLDNGPHHFALVMNAPEGYMKCYLDGELYATSTFTANKFNLTPLITNNIFAGATPFYNGLLLSDLLDKNKTKKTSYFVNDFKLQNIYLHSTDLKYYDIGMLYKEKFLPNSLIFDVPSGRRNYFDVISRYFKQGVPGAKSPLYNIYINDNVLSPESRSKLGVAIINTIKNITPAYSKLNSLNWVTTLPSQSAEYIQPYFPGNTLTNTTQKS